MTKSIFKLFIQFNLTIALLMSCSQAVEQNRIKALDRMTYTINPKIPLIGPVFRDLSDSVEKTKYANSLVALIIKEADGKAHKYLEAGDTQAYYAYLVLSLATPLHEGLFVHFRNVDGDVCNTAANNSELIKKSGNLNFKIFTQYFKNPDRTYFPNCEEMKSKTGVNQMIRGGDGTDLSIMQISIRWHFDDFLANKKYESVSQTLNYGFTHLIKGFDPVYRNISDYTCLFETVAGKKKINYINLIRGIWAGKYNSGSILQTCRFANPNSPYKNHDIGFFKNIEKILNFKGIIQADYVGDFKVDGNSSLAIKEIITNLKENKNSRLSLNKILE